MIGEALPLAYQTLLAAGGASRDNLASYAASNTSAFSYNLTDLMTSPNILTGAIAIPGIIVVLYLMYQLYDEMKRPPSACSIGTFDGF